MSTNSVPFGGNQLGSSASYCVYGHTTLIRLYSVPQQQEINMYSRTYIIGQDESTECPWCAMPLGYGEHAIEIVSEHPDKDCIQEGFCCHTCARNWMHSLKGELIKAVDQWLVNGWLVISR